MKPASLKPLLAVALLATLAAAARVDAVCTQTATSRCVPPVRLADLGVRNDRLAQVVQALQGRGVRAGAVVATSGSGG